MSIDRYYAWLSWFQDQATRIGHPSGHDALMVHRRLQAPTGPPTGAVVHAHLLAEIGTAALVPAAPRVLDAGCGLGGTTFFLQDALGGRYDGVTLSRVQRDRAEAEARRRGVADRCRFHCRSYDDDLTDLFPEGADLIVAIESLAHANDPSSALARWSRLLAPGGLLAIVDDMPGARIAHDDADFIAFRRGWLCPHLLSAADLRAALAATGLGLVADRDLTPLVPRRPPAALARRLGVTRAVLPAARRTPAALLVDSLHGGLCLERLYQRGAMEYRLVLASALPTAFASSHDPNAPRIGR